MVILLVGLEMLVELIDLFRQDSDLDRSGTGIFRVRLETVDDLCFLFFNDSQLTSSLLTLGLVAKMRPMALFLLSYLLEGGIIHI